MSNADAIATVTATLLHLLTGIKIDEIEPRPTSTPLHKMPESVEGSESRINLYLYQTTVNTAWSNMPPPHRTKSGELGHPPLALNLHYLLTTYADSGEDEPDLSQRILGRAMQIFHDHAVLTTQDINTALSGNLKPLAGSGLHEQIERVRITPQPLSLDEMSKLWTIFQTQYRISTAYQVSVVLIDSVRPPRTPLPVLRRGPEDEGVTSQPDLIPPFPTITKLEWPAERPGLHLDDELIIHGYHLADPNTKLTVRLMHPQVKAADTIANEINPIERTDTKISLKITDEEKYPPGLYRLAVAVSPVEEPERQRLTNELSFPLAPQVITPINDPTTDTNTDKLILKVQCKSKVQEKQNVTALVGNAEVAVESYSDSSNELKFDVTDRNKIPAGKYLVRLRVNGVDSFPIIKDEQTGLLKFDEDQKVIIPKGND